MVSTGVGNRGAEHAASCHSKNRISATSTGPSGPSSRNRTRARVPRTARGRPFRHGGAHLRHVGPSIAQYPQDVFAPLEAIPEDPPLHRISTTRSITTTKITKNIIQAIMSATENPWNALRIWTPTPVVPPNVSARAASFHDAANEARDAAEEERRNDGTTMSRRADRVGRP